MDVQDVRCSAAAARDATRVSRFGARGGLAARYCFTECWAKVGEEGGEKGQERWCRRVCCGRGEGGRLLEGRGGSM